MVAKFKRDELKKLSKQIITRAKTLITSQPRAPVITKSCQVAKDDMLYSLVQLTAQKRRLSEEQASYHPFINFLIKRSQQCKAEEQRTLAKTVANFETFLMQTNDIEILKIFYQYFASQQGLVLFRCAPLTIRYFSRSVIKLAERKSHFSAVFFALNQPELLAYQQGYDQLIQQILTDEDLAQMSNEEIRSWIVRLTR